MLGEKIWEKLGLKDGKATRERRRQEQRARERRARERVSQWSVLRLHLLRGSSSRIFTPPSAGAGAGDGAAAAAAGAGGPPVIRMDARVWRKMPEDMIWEVVRFAPATKLVQWQLVSRKWRRELTSAHFRKRLRETWAQQPQQAEQSGSSGSGGAACTHSWPCVVPCGSRNNIGSSIRWSDIDADKTFEVDVSPMVPYASWNRWDAWEREPYHVVGAAHGLVCITRDRAVRISNVIPEPEPYHYVLNPLTRKCVLLPPLPFLADRWCLPAATTGAADVTIWGWSATRTAWVMATYDLAAAANCKAGAHGQYQRPSYQWVVAHKPAGVPGWALAADKWWLAGDEWMQLPMYAVLGGESYWYNRDTDRMHVLAAGGAEVGALDGPKVWETPPPPPPHHEQLGQLDERGGGGAPSQVTEEWVRDTSGHYFVGPVPVVVPERGAVFLVSDLRLEPSRGALVDTGVAMWRLVRDHHGERMEWEPVARMDGAELVRLNAPLSRRLGPHLDAGKIYMELYHAYAVRQLVCCHVIVIVHGAFRPRVSLHCVLGFNLDTRKWELVQEHPDDWHRGYDDHKCSRWVEAMEMRPDTALDWSSQDSLAEAESTLQSSHRCRITTWMHTCARWAGLGRNVKS